MRVLKVLVPVQLSCWCPSGPGSCCWFRRAPAASCVSCGVWAPTTPCCCRRPPRPRTPNPSANLQQGFRKFIHRFALQLQGDRWSSDMISGRAPAKTFLPLFRIVTPHRGKYYYRGWFFRRESKALEATSVCTSGTNGTIRNVATDVKTVRGENRSQGENWSAVTDPLVFRFRFSITFLCRDFINIDEIFCYCQR